MEKRGRLETPATPSPFGPAGVAVAKYRGDLVCNETVCAVNSGIIKKSGSSAARLKPWIASRFVPGLSRCAKRETSNSSKGKPAGGTNWQRMFAKSMVLATLPTQETI